MISTLAARRRLLLGGAGLGLVLLVSYLVFGGTAPARLLAVEPADGTAVTVPPTAVTLRFTAAPQPRVVHITVVGPGGADVTRGAPVVADTLVKVPVTAALPGRYRVGFHLELGDGSPVSGLATFTVGSGAEAAAGPAEAADQAHGGHHLERNASTLVLVLIDLTLMVGLVWLLARRSRVR
ncbi:copper resistance CopC family protein [Actinoplanes sp. NPDC049599]|uniref:copper resistance CopC family protein n=1 Tax=Actinoplanes sp. NPDC049599 TaxID=3363903 RepID=UPI0037A646A7